MKTGKFNYRVDYKLGDRVETAWVDADYFEIDSGGVGRFWVGAEENVFTATWVFGVTLVKENNQKPLQDPQWLAPLAPFEPSPCCPGLPNPWPNPPFWNNGGTSIVDHNYSWPVPNIDPHNYSGTTVD